MSTYFNFCWMWPSEKFDIINNLMDSNFLNKPAGFVNPMVQNNKGAQNSLMRTANVSNASVFSRLSKRPTKLTHIKGRPSIKTREVTTQTDIVRKSEVTDDSDSQKQQEVSANPPLDLKSENRPKNKNGSLKNKNKFVKKNNTIGKKVQKNMTLLLLAFARAAQELVNDEF